MEPRTEFLKHLRLVHFTLVVTSLVLLVGSSLTPNYVLESAYRQSGEVRRAAAPLMEWAREVDPADLWDQVDGLNEQGPLYLSDGSAAYHLLKPYGYTRVRDETGSFLSSKDIFHPYHFVPATLEEFARLWNDLYEWSHVLVVTNWAADGSVVEVLDGSSRNLVISGELPPGTEPRQMANGRKFRVELRRSGWSLVVDVEPRFTLGEEGGELELLPVSRISIPISAEPYPRDLQVEAVRSLGISWLPGTFDESFAQLSQFAAGIESAELDVIEKHIGRLRAEQGASIELFGAAVPSDALRTWGLLILVGVQLYFALHLDRYCRAFAGGTRDDEFPWLGTYTSLPARIAFVGTVSVLPVAAIVSVLSTEANPASHWTQGIFSWGAAGGGFSIAAIAFLQVIRIHQAQRGPEVPDA